MVRIGRRSELCLVARVTVGRRQFVGSVLVTRHALHCLVRSRQWKTGECVVIESRLPGHCGHSMTLIAVCRESCRGVIGVRGADEVIAVTTNTRGRRADELIVADAAVAILARNGGVKTDQRKPG